MKKILLLIPLVFLVLFWVMHEPSAPTPQKEETFELVNCTPHEDVLLKVRDTVFSIPRKNFLWAENEKRESLGEKARCGRAEDRPLTVRLFAFMIRDTFPVKYTSIVDGRPQTQAPALAMIMRVYDAHGEKSSYEKISEEIENTKVTIDHLPLIGDFYTFDSRFGEMLISRNQRNKVGEPIMYGCVHRRAICGVSLLEDGVKVSVGEIRTEFVPIEKLGEFYQALEDYIASLKCTDCR